MPFIIFLAGLCVGSLLTKKANVVVVDNGTIAAELKTEDTVLVVKDGNTTELRQVKENLPPVKKVVYNPNGGKFYRNSFGEWTMDCTECSEDTPAEKETSIWKSSGDKTEGK